MSTRQISFKAECFSTNYGNFTGGSTNSINNYKFSTKIAALKMALNYFDLLLYTLSISLGRIIFYTLEL